MRADRVRLCVLLLGVGAILIGAGCFLFHRDLSFLATFLGQAGTTNPRLLEKLALIPTLLIVTGAQCLLLAGACSLRWRGSSFSDSAAFTSRHWLPGLLLGGWVAISVSTLNFGWISLDSRWARGLSPAEQVAEAFGDEDRVVRAVHEMTPESAAILIRTQRPLQFLLNYELYPRRFYFYSDRSLPIAAIPEEWLKRRHISWTLEISDDAPLQFELARREGAF